jgi:hypothetical protein
MLKKLFRTGLRTYPNLRKRATKAETKSGKRLMQL